MSQPAGPSRAKKCSRGFGSSCATAIRRHSLSVSWRWSVRAEVDLAEIALFIADSSPSAASRFYEEMDSAAAHLARNPQIAPRHPDIKNPKVRAHRVRHWFLIFEADMEPLAIARVINASRDLRSLRL